MLCFLSFFSFSRSHLHWLLFSCWLFFLCYWKCLSLYLCCCFQMILRLSQLMVGWIVVHWTFGDLNPENLNKNFRHPLIQLSKKIILMQESFRELEAPSPFLINFTQLPQWIIFVNFIRICKPRIISIASTQLQK